MSNFNKFWLHVFFWLFFGIIPRLIAPPALQVDWFFIIILALDVISFYLFFLLIIPQYFKTGNKGKVIILSFIIFLCLVFARIFLSEIYSNYNAFLYDQINRSLTRFCIKEIISGSLFVIYPLMLTFTVRYFSVQKAKAELMAQQKESELSLLRSQINPHFLFNTLNNIYSLVYSGSPDAHKSVMMLSELMRYSLYKSSTEMVTLDSEIQYINNYIELELLRLKNKNFIVKDILNETSGLEIVHMMLIPFVENAFKYSDKNASTPSIRIKIRLDGTVLKFYISNKIDREMQREIKNESGIGLSNVKKRLDLLYTGNYNLEIIERDNEFTVKLTLDLK